MSILRKIFASRDSGSYQPSSPYLGQLFGGGGPTLSGVQVNERTALLSSAVWAATRLYAASSGMLSRCVYERLPGGGKREADPDHYAQKIARSPSSKDNPFLFEAVETIHQINGGNGLAEIVRNGRGEPVDLCRIHPSRVQAPRTLPDGRMIYDVSDANGQRQILAENMYHVPNIVSDDGVWGKGVVTHARETIGAAIAHTRKGAADLGNRSVPPLVVEHPNKLSDTARSNFREEWELLHKGPDNSGRMAILQEGMKAHVLGLPNKDMEFIALGNFTVEDLARWWSLPPHKIGSLLRATFSNIDQQSLEFVIFSLIPIQRMKEVEFNRKILLPQDQGRFFLRYNVDGLLRGDPEKRAHALQTQFMNGALLLDEWRDLEDRNPLPNGMGQKYFVPRSLIPIEQAIQGAQAAPVQPKQSKPAAPPQPSAPPADQPKQEYATAENLRNGFVNLFAQTYSRLGRKEAQAARKAAERPAKFLAWVDEFYPDHAKILAEALQPTFEMQVLVVDRILNEQALKEKASAQARLSAEKRTNQSREKLLTLTGQCRPSELAKTVESFARECEAVLPGQFASEDAGASHAL